MCPTALTYETYYPGDQYVDWIGVSTYKNGGPGYGSSYTYADTAHSNDAFYCSGIYGSDPLIVLDDLAALAEAHKKPMMISECGFGYRNKSTGQTRPPTRWTSSTSSTPICPWSTPR